MSEQDQYGSVEDVRQALGLGRPTEPSAVVEPEPATRGETPEADRVEPAAEPPAATAASDTSTHNPDANEWLAPGVPKALGHAEKAAADREFFERLYGLKTGGRMSQPRRVQFINGVPFPIIEDEWPTRPGPVDFDCGVRGDPPPQPSRLHAYREPGGWVTVEYEDGADWLFPHLRGR